MSQQLENKFNKRGEGLIIPITYTLKLYLVTLYVHIVITLFTQNNFLLHLYMEKKRSMDL